MINAKDTTDLIRQYESLMHSLGIPLTSVLRRAGVHQSAFSHWKHNRRAPTVANCLRIQLAIETERLARLEMLGQPRRTISLPFSPADVRNGRTALDGER